MTEVGALVLGGDYRGLGIVRSLGRRGVDVWVAHDKDTLATHSRYCTRALRWTADEDGIRLLLELADRAGLDGWTLFPTSDETAWLVSRHREALSRHFRVTTPPWHVYSVAADKAAVHEVATALGVATPQTWFPRGADDLDAMASGGELDGWFPLVVKPATRQEANALTVDKGWRVADRAELVRRYREAAAIVAPSDIMIQEWVAGDGLRQYSFAAVCAAGDVRLSVTARRARQYPRDFGRASSYVETVEHDGVAKDATRLLHALGIDGLVEVEFKEDETTGVLKLLDVNVRVWGWHSLGATAGVDFAYGAHRLALGEPVDVRSGRPGVRWARFAIDAPYALRDIVAGRLRPGEYLRTVRRPIEGPVAARDDPMPALAEIPLLFRTVWRQRRSHPTVAP